MAEGKQRSSIFSHRYCFFRSSSCCSRYFIRISALLSTELRPRLPINVNSSVQTTRNPNEEVVQSMTGHVKSYFGRKTSASVLF